MSNAVLKAPFPYFGGKSRVAELVWSRLGDVRNYIEPFYGSGAVHLLRPHEPKIETINDFDCYVANFWRATQQAPQEVAAHADYPVSEADLHARHRWLVLSQPAAEFRERMRTDPEYFDIRIAGWWVWGICCWIGGGWCELKVNPKKQMPETSGDTAGKGVHRLQQRRAKLSGHGVGNGVHKKRPKLTGNPRLSQQIPDLSGDGGAAGRGVHASGLSNKLPDISGKDNGSGRGIHQASGGRPQLADGRGVHSHDDASTCESRRAWLVEWFSQLRDRLRPVRICCGDWKRVCGSRSVTTRIGITGVFLDPPYKGTVDGKKNRDAKLYASENLEIADECRKWCITAGKNQQMRIALCGYEGEHNELESHGWKKIAWQAHGGYANRNPDNNNADRERIWFSPHCLLGEDLPLFRGEEG